jgi:putative flippase GtrA
MINKERILQFTRFCAVGGSVALIDLTVVWLSSHLFPALVAVSLGYITGATCHFLLNKFWVFRCNSQQYRRQLAFYLLHAALYWLMTVLIVSLVLHITGVSVVVARLISIPPMMFFTFCFLRFVVFKKARLSPGPFRPDAYSTPPDARQVITPEADAYRLGADFEANA